MSFLTRTVTQNGKGQEVSGVQRDSRKVRNNSQIPEFAVTEKEAEIKCVTPECYTG